MLVTLQALAPYRQKDTICTYSIEYYSPVYLYVLQQAVEKPLSQSLLARQLLFYGRLVGLNEHSMLRNSVLQPNSPTPKQFLNKRTQGNQVGLGFHGVALFMRML
ncbi:unnamed protein product [Polarella glacialis]|uniref:Uncharacterized protein n=1 Tax=Polarella glacialis TaxID=89957 RepID=A0A813GQE0_POLGL|nr:unnamed protein product [Polarella glacialis]